MITLGKRFVSGISRQCRSRGRHLATSLSAVAAAGDVLPELQQAIPGRSSALGALPWRHRLCHGLGARSQTGEAYLRVDDHLTTVCLDRGIPSPPWDTGAEQMLGFWGRTPLACLDRISVVENSASRRERPSAHELQKDRRESLDEPKQLGSVEELDSCGQGTTALRASGDVDISSLGRKAVLGQEEVDGSHALRLVFTGKRAEAAPFIKYPVAKSQQRKRKLPGTHLKIKQRKSKPPRTQEKCQGRRNSTEATLNPRHAKTVHALNRQISILMDTDYCEEAYAVYEKMIAEGLKPDSYTYLHLISGFCKGGKLAVAQEVFRKFLDEEVLCGSGSEVILYNAMVHGLGSAGAVKEALNLVEEMTQRGFAMNLYTYNSILHSLGKVGRVTEAMTVFESMAGRGCTPNVVTYNSLINCLGKAGRLMEAYRLYEGMIKDGCLPGLVTFNTLLPILGKTGELALALELYKFMTTIGCQPDVYTYTSLVTILCRANRIDEALLLSVEMTERGCAPNTVTFNTWLDGLCKGGRVVEALELFHKMLGLGYSPDSITYCILIDASCKTGQYLEKSFELFKNLLKCTCVLDKRTAEIVYQSFKKVGMLKQAKRIARNARAKQFLGNGPVVKA